MSRRRDPFLIVGLPRSRTAWLAKFLTYETTRCWHEPSIGFRSLADLSRFFGRRNIGASDSALTLHWRFLRASHPRLRLVAVRRPIAEVTTSLARIGFADPQLDRMLALVADALAEAEAEPGTMCVSYDALNNEAVCAEIFRFCAQRWYDAGHWHYWQARRVEADPAEMMARLTANAEGVRTLFGRFLEGERCHSLAV